MTTPAVRGVVVDVVRVRAAASALRGMASVRERTRLADQDLKKALARQKAQADTADEKDFSWLVGGVDVRGDAAEAALSRAVRVLADWSLKAVAAQEKLDSDTSTALGGSPA